MKILFLSGLYPPETKGGGELSTHYIAQGLVTLGHNVVVVTQGKQRERATHEGVVVERLPLPFTAKPLFERRHMRKLAHRFKEMFDWQEFDLIHAHDFRMAQMLSELGLSNAIVTARDYAQICGSPNNLLSDGSMCRDTSLATTLRNQAVVEAPWWRKPFRIWQYRYNIGYRLSSFQKFRYQIFISEAQRQEIKQVQDLTNTKTKVIYNPIAPAYATAPPRTNHSKEVLFVGTIQKYKGVGLLLEAFREIAEANPDIHLTVIGEGMARKYYESQVSHWGLSYRVKFTGRVSPQRLRDYYDAALIVVAPHLWVEPFGRVVIEAMARARAVLAANIGGPAEIIKEGETGWLFEHGSRSSLVTTLREILNLGELERYRIQDEARKWVLNNLKAEQIAQAHEAAYAELLSDTDTRSAT